MQRSRGTTTSEEVLAKYASHAFFKLWSYANVFRDQGNGKEVADLIVVFDHHVLLFSDKHIEFQSGELTTAWTRWKRRAVEKSILQVVGAKRWISEHPDTLFIDPGCTERFPISIDPRACVFHLVCVAGGAAERCRSEIGGSGSLITVVDSQDDSRPFCVSPWHKETLVHIFDEVSMPLVLSEMDTAPDFISYIVNRYNFISSGQLAVSSGDISRIK
jgi:hypothetical protein